MKNQKRVVIDHVSPQINNGEFFIKRIVDEIVNVDAHVLVDGHDVIAASVLYKHEKSKSWNEVRMQLINNDEWKASFGVDKQGFYTYKVEGWVDYALNWQHGIERKIADNQFVKSELLEGVTYLKPLLKQATKNEKIYLESCIAAFEDEQQYDKAIQEAQSEQLHAILVKYPEKHLSNTTQDFQVYVDRKKARFSTWYEFFPRSASEIDGRNGTFKDCEQLLPRVAQMGFDTLYFPPVHPIGEVNRKGKNNTTEAYEGDVGSAWGLGSQYGGHKDIHPELGTVEDFKEFSALP